MLARACFRTLVLALLTVSAGPWTASAGAQTPVKAPPESLPKVRLVATGGTISNHAGGRLTAGQLVGLVPDLERYARVESEQFSNVASSQLTLAQWLELARRINALFAADRDLAGVVVTSGTDTLEETAYFLNLAVRTEKPVVIVGSMRNPSTPGYEGAANLLAAIRVAAEPASTGRGVLVVLNDEINAARDVTKTDALRLHTFQSRGYGILGVVDRDRVIYYRRVVKRHTRNSEFDVDSISELPRVDIVLVYQGASGDVIRALADAGAKGIVIASAGAGAMSGTQVEGVRYATEKGVVVVSTTRSGSGRIASPSSASGGSRQNALMIRGEDLQPLKARVLLMLALAHTKDTARIQRMFTEY